MAEERYNLTEQGEATAVEDAGGQDVVNVVALWMAVLKHRGHLINPELKPDFREWGNLCVVAQATRILLGTSQWATFVGSCESDLRKIEPQYFNTTPCAYGVGTP